MRKELALELKKNILLIDENEMYLSDHEFDIQDEWRNTDFKLICKGDELKEETLEDLVFRSKIGRYKNYKHKSGSLDNGLLDALLEMKFETSMESFISAVESKGFWWGGKKVHSISTEEEFDELWSSFCDWDNTERKTFNPETTYIFEYETRVV